MSDKIRPYRILVAAALLVPLLLFAIVMWQDYRSMEIENHRVVNRTAELFQQHALNVFETHHLVCERVNERLRGMSWGEIGKSSPLRDYLKQICNKYPQVQAIWLADSAGIVRNSSQLLPASPVTVADRDYFLSLREFDSDLFIGHIVNGRVMNGLNFNIAHRRENKTGTFDGVVIVTVFPEYFSKFWDNAGERDIAAGLIRKDGMFLARAPQLDPDRLKLPATSDTMRAISGGEQGSYLGTSSIDGSKRYYAFRKVGGYNAYMVYGAGTKAVLKEWQQHVLHYGGLFGAATLALLLLSLVTLKRAQQEQQAKQALNRAYADMESRVLERTIELNKANTELTNEIFERRSAEEIIRKSGAYNRSLIEASLDPLVTIGQDGRITDVNTATEAVTGYPREMLIGTDFSDYFTEPEKARMGYRQVFQEGLVRDYPLEIRRCDGQVTAVLYNATVYRDEGGEVLGVFAAARDITELKRTEELLRQREQEFRSLAENSPDNIARYDAGCRLTYVNPALRRSVNIDFEARLGKRPLETPPGGRAEFRRYEDMLRSVLESGKPGEIEINMPHPDGEYHTHQILFVAERDEQGNVTGALTIGRDITERKRMEVKISKINEELEQRVQERTAELEGKNAELARLNRVFVGRELRMVELKERIRELEMTSCKSSV